MILHGKYRVGFVLTLMGLAALFIAGGGWAGFSAFEIILLDAASGVVSETRHLNDLFLLQNTLWTMSVLTAVLLTVAIVLLDLHERRVRRSSEEIVRRLREYASGDWSHDPHVHDGEALDDIALALKDLAKTSRSGAGGALKPGDEAEEIKTRFLEIISHQLRTPLTAVRWNIEALLRGEVGDLNRRQDELLRITDKNYQNILVMLSDWVEALEVERGLLHLNPEPLPVAAFVETLADEFRSQAKLKDLSFRVTVSRQLGKVYGDRLKLHYVFNKLLHNAMSYTREGGRVAFRVAPEGPMVRFEVEDSGVGIPMSEQADIFNKFFRASNAALMQPNASGVGLFVTKVLVEAHGGTIGFESVEGKGTAFIVRIPAAGAAAVKAARPVRRAAAKSVAPRKSPKRATKSDL